MAAEELDHQQGGGGGDGVQETFYIIIGEFSTFFLEGDDLFRSGSSLPYNHRDPADLLLPSVEKGDDRLYSDSSSAGQPPRVGRQSSLL